MMDSRSRMQTCPDCGILSTAWIKPVIAQTEGLDWDSRLSVQLFWPMAVPVRSRIGPAVFASVFLFHAGNKEINHNYYAETTLWLRPWISRALALTAERVGTFGSDH